MACLPGELFIALVLLALALGMLIAREILGD